jgi:putative LysE/RhtB family amino acid efflux pump
MTVALAAGLGLGFLVGAQVGPIWLLCVRSTLRRGWQVGAAIGLGAALIDMLYALLGALGASALLQVSALTLTLGLIGAAVLAYLGLKMLWSAFRVRLGGEAHEEVLSPRRALLTSLGATASNPLTIASWAAVFAAAMFLGRLVVVAQLAAMVPYALAYPLLDAVTAILYYDIRARKEGYDLELMAQELAAQPAPRPAY